MAFGIKREELLLWKRKAGEGNIAFITHFWYDPRFPHYQTVTKAACANKEKLISWGLHYGLKAEWIHDRQDFPHFDLLGEKQKEILERENEYDQLEKLEKRLKG